MKQGITASKYMFVMGALSHAALFGVIQEQSHPPLSLKEIEHLVKNWQEECDIVLLLDGQKLEGQLQWIPKMQFSFGTIPFKIDEIKAIAFTKTGSVEKLQVITHDGLEYYAQSSKEPIYFTSESHERRELDPKTIRAIIFKDQKVGFKEIEGAVFDLELKNGDRIPVSMITPQVKLTDGLKEFLISPSHFLSVRFEGCLQGTYDSGNGFAEDIKFLFVRDKDLQVKLSKTGQALNVPWSQIAGIKKVEKLIISPTTVTAEAEKVKAKPLNEWQEKAKESIEKNRVLEQEIAQLKTVLQEKENSYRSFEKHAQEKENALFKKIELLSDSLTELDQTKVSLQEKERALADSKEKYQQLLVDLEAVKSNSVEVSSLLEKVANAAKENEALSAEYQGALAKNELFAKENSELNAQIVSLQNQVQELIPLQKGAGELQRLTEGFAQKEAELAKLIDEEKQNSERKDHEIASLNQKLEILQGYASESARLEALQKRSSTDIENYCKEIEEKKEQILSLAQALEEHKTKIGEQEYTLSLQTMELQTLRGIAQEAARLEGLQKKSLTDIEQYSKEIGEKEEEIRSLAENIEQQKEKIEQQKQMIARQTLELESLREVAVEAARFEDLHKKSSSDIEIYTQQISEKEEQIRSLAANVDHLRGQIEEKEYAFARQTMELDALRGFADEVARLEALQKKSLNDIEQYVKQIGEKEEQIRSMTASIDQQRVKIEEQEHALARQTLELETLSGVVSEATKLHALHQDSQNEIRELFSQIEDYQHKLVFAEQRKSLLEDQLQETKNLLEAKKEQLEYIIQIEEKDITDQMAEIFQLTKKVDEQQETIARFNQQLNEREIALNEANSLIDKIKGDNYRVSHELRSSNDEAIMLKEALSSALEKLAENEQVLSSVENTLRSKEDQKIVLDEQIEQLQKALARSEEQAIKSEGELATSQELLFHANETLTYLKGALQETEKEKSSLEREIGQLENIVASLKEQASERDEAIASLENNLKANEQLRVDLQGEIIVLKDQVAQREDKLASLENSLQSNEQEKWNLQGVISSLKDQVAQKEEKLAFFENSLQVNEQERWNLEGEINSLKEQSVQWEKKYISLENALHANEQQRWTLHNEIAVLKEQAEKLASLESTLQVNEQEKSKLQGEIAALKDQAVQREEKLASLENILQVNEQDKRNLQGEIAALKDQVVHFENTLQTNEQARWTLQNEITALKDQAVQREEKLASLENTLQVNDQEKWNLQGEIAALKDQVVHFENTLQTNEQARWTLQNEITVLKDQAVQREEKLASLENTLQVNDQEKWNLQGEIVALKDQVVHFENMLQTNEQEKWTLQNEITALKDQAVQREENFATVQNTLQSELDQAYFIRQEEKRALDEKIAEAKIALKEKIALLDESNSERQNQLETINTLNQSLHSTREEIAFLKQEVDQKNKIAEDQQGEVQKVLASWHQEKESLQQHLAVSQEKFEAVKNELERVLGSLELQTQKSMDLSHSIQVLEEEKGALLENLIAIQIEDQRLKEEFERAIDGKDLIEKKLSLVSSELQDRLEQILAMEERIQNEQKQQSFQQEKIASFESLLEQREFENQAIKQQMERLQEQLLANEQKFFENNEAIQKKLFSTLNEQAALKDQLAEKEEAYLQVCQKLDFANSVVDQLNLEVKEIGEKLISATESRQVAEIALNDSQGKIKNLSKNLNEDATLLQQKQEQASYFESLAEQYSQKVVQFEEELVQAKKRVNFCEKEVIDYREKAEQLASALEEIEFGKTRTHQQLGLAMDEIDLTRGELQNSLRETHILKHELAKALSDLQRHVETIHSLENLVAATQSKTGDLGFEKEELENQISRLASRQKETELLLESYENTIDRLHKDNRANQANQAKIAELEALTFVKEQQIQDLKDSLQLLVSKYDTEKKKSQALEQQFESIAVRLKHTLETEVSENP